MSFLYALRYFQVVAVVPRLFIAAFVVVVAAAAARLTTDPSAAIDALTPVLLLQMFAASSGFQVPARRGHYDLLLTSGTPRWQIASAHCVASIVPGIASWLCVGMLELAASHGAHAAFAAAGTCRAFLLVSLVAWATATPMPRGTAAVGWLLIVTIPPLARVASPVQLLGTHPNGPLAAKLLSVLAIAMIPVIVAVARIVRGSVPLEAAQ
jgi:hypothetical protein